MIELPYLPVERITTFIDLSNLDVGGLNPVLLCRKQMYASVSIDVFLVTASSDYLFVAYFTEANLVQLGISVGLLLDLGKVPVFSNLLVLDYRWSHNPPSC